MEYAAQGLLTISSAVDAGYARMRPSDIWTLSAAIADGVVMGETSAAMESFSVPLKLSNYGARPNPNNDSTTFEFKYLYYIL